MTAPAAVSPALEQPGSVHPELPAAALSEDPNSQLYECTAAAEVDFINAQESCRGPRRSWIGRLIYSLNIVGATSGMVPSQENLDAIDETTKLMHPKCPNRKARRAYRQVIGLKLLQRI